MLCKGAVSSTDWTDFFMVLTMTMSGRSFETMTFTGRVPPVVKPSISEKIWMLFDRVRTDGVFQLLQNVDKDRIMTPGKSALVKESRTRIQNMNKGFLVATKFAFSL